VDYVHWDDPVIPDALSNFDGVFLVPSSETIPPALLERFSQANNVVALDTDLSGWKIPSVELLPPIIFQHLAEHLYGLGHRHIDCFNTQPHDQVMTRRIEQWQLWQKVRKVEGRLIDDPVEPWGDALPHAYLAMKKLLDAGEFNATAMVCLTEPAATGAARAIYEHGLQLGKDVSLCASDGSRRGRYMCPSLTVIELPDPEPYLEVCLDWLIKRSGCWVGPLLIQPTNIPLIIGESTGSAPRSIT
jgi:DNA-binding LacI/PurR family transcriptional regulator